MRIKTYKDAVEVLNGRVRRKVANNTYLIRRDENTVALQLHDTDVVTYQPGTVTLDSGGWRTKTTADRMRYAVQVFTRGGAWYVCRPGERMWDATGAWLYADGITLDEDGHLITGAGAIESVAERAALAKKINSYARLCAEQAKELTFDDEFDCWQCGMVEWSDQDTDHLLRHMDEREVIPSLVLRALEAKGYRVPQFLLGHPWAVRTAVRDLLKAVLLPEVTQSGFIKQRVMA